VPRLADRASDRLDAAPGSSPSLTRLRAPSRPAAPSSRARKAGGRQTPSGPQVVDISHWLENGALPAENSRLRREALRVVRFIEYGGPLRQHEGRETLIECGQRLRGKACGGFLWVSKRVDNQLSVFCSRCHRIEAVVSGWEGTLWADGPMPPLPMIDD
jgi:hypothetical protein